MSNVTSTFRNFILYQTTPGSSINNSHNPRARSPVVQDAHIKTLFLACSFVVSRQRGARTFHTWLACQRPAFESQRAQHVFFFCEFLLPGRRVVGVMGVFWAFEMRLIGVNEGGNGPSSVLISTAGR